ncbi:MAG TPA: hypothetical protein VK672_07045 [Solirubrobacteraceae bacterium]|nr:hypothetical protein [Solirubrobacteraceae bacterium]
MLRLLRNLDRDEAARATRAALGHIRALSDRAELTDLVGYREDSGHELVSEEDATALEQSLFDDVLRADDDTLGGERDLLRLLLRVHGGCPSETSAHVEGLVEEDAFLLSLLRAALGETVGQAMGDAAVRRSHRLSWGALAELVPQERFAERVKQLADRVAVDDLDERTRMALEQATLCADNPSLAEEHGNRP